MKGLTKMNVDKETGRKASWGPPAAFERREGKGSSRKEKFMDLEEKYRRLSPFRTTTLASYSPTAPQMTREKQRKGL